MAMARWDARLQRSPVPAPLAGKQGCRAGWGSGLLDLEFGVGGSGFAV